MDQNAAYLNESRAPAILAGCILPIILATITVFGRLYSRCIILRNWGGDDTLILISWLLAIALTMVNCVLVDFGSGRHITFVLLHPPILAGRLKLVYVSRILYQTVIGTTKLGTCELYLRVFSDKSSRIMIRSLEAFISIFTFSLLCDVIFRFRHIPDAWLPGGTLRTCHTALPGLYISSVCNILSDALLVAFVMPRIWPLKMARRQKIALLCVASLGSLVIIAAVVNITRVIHTNSSKDVTSLIGRWGFFRYHNLERVEVGTGLVCTSAPAMKPTIRKFVPSFLSSLYGTQSGPTNYHRKPTYGSASVLSRGFGSPPAGKGQSIELSSHSNHDLLTNNGITNTFWRGDEESMIFDDGDCESLVIQGSSKENIVKTISVKVEERREGVGTNEEGVKVFEAI